MIWSETLFTPLQAARQVKVGKATIHRAIKSGKLSAQRQEDGSYLIDPAELARVYDLSHTVTQRQRETALEGLETPLLQEKLTGALALQEMLERQLADVKAEREDLKADRDAWRQQAERLALPHPIRNIGIVARLFGRKAG